jgi:hypothetical protein
MPLIDDDDDRNSGCRALRGETLRKALSISAIVVNHVVVLDGFNPGLGSVIQRLRHPRIGIGGGFSTRGRRGGGRPNAGLGIVVTVRGCEWGLTPISLH